jgi:hypothetical protein
MLIHSASPRFAVGNNSKSLGNEGIGGVSFPHRSGPKLNRCFTTAPTLTPERLLALYAARFKIEDCFEELKTVGGFADCRPAPKVKENISLKEAA